MGMKTLSSHKSKAKSVSFHNDVLIYPCRPALSMVKDRDPTLLWYSSEETEEIRQKTALLVRYVQQHQDDNKLDNGKRLCTRGLEKMLNPYYHYGQRQLARHIVFHEQKMQGGYIYDDEVLSRAYSSVSEQSQRDANERGAADAKIAAVYLRKTRRDMDTARDTVQSLRQKHCRLQRKDSLRGLY